MNGEDRIRILPSGDAAVLVELADLGAMLGLYAALAADPPPGIADIVPAARTLTLLLGPGGDPGVVAAAVRAARPATASTVTDTVTVPVVYDGEDLDEVAGLTG